MKPFQPPTTELARRILGEVDFHDRLIGHKMRMGHVADELEKNGKLGRAKT